MIDGVVKLSTRAAVPPAVQPKRRKTTNSHRRWGGVTRLDAPKEDTFHHPPGDGKSQVPRALRRLSFKFVGGAVRTVGAVSASSVVTEARGAPSVSRVVISVDALVSDRRGFHSAAPVKQSSVRAVKKQSAAPLQSMQTSRRDTKTRKENKRDAAVAASAALTTATGKLLPSWKVSSSSRSSSKAATLRAALPFKVGPKLGAGTAGLVAVATLRRPVLLPPTAKLERRRSRQAQKTGNSVSSLTLPVGLELAVKFFVQPVHGDVRYAPSLYCEGWREMCIHSALTGHPRILPLLGTFVGTELLEPSYALIARGRSDLSHALENGRVAGVTLRLFCAEELLLDESPFASSVSSDSSRAPSVSTNPDSPKNVRDRWVPSLETQLDRQRKFLLSRVCPIAAAAGTEPADLQPTRVLFEILQGLVFMHASGLLHRDLKPHNIIVMPNGVDVWICDFSLATHVGFPSQDPAANALFGGDLFARTIKSYDVDGSCIHTPDTCTLLWRAPEIVIRKLLPKLRLSYGRAADVWSVGVIAVELFTGMLLFGAPEERSDAALILEMRKILGEPTLKSARGEFVENFMGAVKRAAQKRCVTAYPAQLTYEHEAGIGGLLEDAYTRSHCGIDGSASAVEANASALADLVSAMLALDPARRITAGDALKHRFFDDVREGCALPLVTPSRIELPPAVGVLGKGYVKTLNFADEPSEE